MKNTSPKPRRKFSKAICSIENGHVFLPRDKLINAAAALIDCAPDRIEMTLDDLITRGAIRCEQVAKVQACYLRRLYDAEKNVTEKLNLMLRIHPDTGRNIEKIKQHRYCESSVDDG